MHFENYIQDYLTEKRRADGVSADHKSLINTLSAIRLAEIKSLWTDDLSLLPSDPDEAFWWEVWLPVRGNRNAVVTDFHRISHATGCQVSEHKVDFPERTITWMYGSQSQFSQARLVLNCVAELRRAKDTAEFFEGLPALEQQLWVDDALRRLRFLHPKTMYLISVCWIQALIAGTLCLHLFCTSRTCIQSMTRGESMTPQTMVRGWLELQSMAI
ncbi:hypothetical protein ACKU2C_028000 [Klebsiella pneumoniae]